MYSRREQLTRAFSGKMVRTSTQPAFPRLSLSPNLKMGFLQTAINIFDQTCLNCRKYDENLIFSPNLFSRPSDWKQNEEKIEFVFYVASPILSGVVESSDLHNCPNTLAQTCSMLIDVTTRKFFIDTSQNDSCIPDICRKRREP